LSRSVICAFMTLAPAPITSANITAIVFSCFFITFFSLIRESNLFNGLLRFLAFPDNRQALGAGNPIVNRSCYQSRADCTAMVMPGFCRRDCRGLPGMARVARDGRMRRRTRRRLCGLSDQPSNQTEAGSLRRLSIHLSIASDDLQWDKKVSKHSP